MAKTVRNVKNSLKFKAPVKSGIISVRVGVKKYTLPCDARLLASDSCLFLSIPACSELFVIDNGQLQAMDPNDDATAVYKALNPERKRSSRSRAQKDLPKELEQALKAIPDGYKLAYAADGAPRLVRTRRRRSKKNA